MLRVLGSPKRLCDGSTRRDFLLAGGLGTLGLTLPDFLRNQHARASQPAPTTVDPHLAVRKRVSCCSCMAHPASSNLPT